MNKGKTDLIFTRPVRLRGYMIICYNNKTNECSYYTSGYYTFSPLKDKIHEGSVYLDSIQAHINLIRARQKINAAYTKVVNNLTLNLIKVFANVQYNKHYGPNSPPIFTRIVPTKNYHNLILSSL